MKRKILALALAVVMVLSLLPTTALAAYSDTTGNWAESVINKWSEEGVLGGDEGLFRPDAFIRRGELAKILDIVFAYKTTSKASFSDLGNQWYKDHILRLNAAGVMLGGDGKIRGDDNITRQEAMTMFARAFSVVPYGDAVSTFADGIAVKRPGSLTFDLVFIDGDKREYPAYYNLLMDGGLVKSGSYILSDNVLWYGKVLEDTPSNDTHTRAIRAFNDLVQADPRVENVILPLRDGMTVIRVL